MKEHHPENIWNKKAVLKEAEEILHPNKINPSTHPLLEKISLFRQKLNQSDSPLIGLLIVMGGIFIEPISYAKTLYQYDHKEKAILVIAGAIGLPLTVIAASIHEGRAFWETALTIPFMGLAGIYLAGVHTDFRKKQRQSDF